MDAGVFANIIGADFYAGVPDSQLKPLCDYLMDAYGTDARRHVIAANEGSCVAIAAGYHLATGKVPVVYMQNSGEGNIVNPVASLLNDKVYAIPMLFVIGWRGEPGVQDEPQHIYQGEITLRLLDSLGIRAFVIGEGTTKIEVQDASRGLRHYLAQGRQAAFVIRKNALSYGSGKAYGNRHEMIREVAIAHILEASGTDPVVSTTGKASRELFEIRERSGQGHKYDFLTVGSMGHCSSIALGVALQKPGTTVWCIDGDGAVLMHMGSLAVIGQACPGNLVHVVVNNGAHESVGGMPTAAGGIDLASVARVCGYAHAASVCSYLELDRALAEARSRKGPCFIEAKCALGAREDLGRPSTSAVEDKKDFMGYLSGLE